MRPASVCKWVVLGVTFGIATQVSTLAQTSTATRDALNQQQQAAAMVAAHPTTPTTSDTQHVVGASSPNAQNSTVGSDPSMAAKRRIVAEKDIPHIRYPLHESASNLVVAGGADFNAFLAHYGPDLNTLLTGFSIENKELLLRLWEAEEDAAILAGDRKGAELALEKQRDLETQAERSLFGLSDYAFLHAWKKTGAENGDQFEKAYAEDYAHRVNSLPWDKVKEQLVATAAECAGSQPTPQLEYVKVHLDPETTALHAVMLGQADRIVIARKAVQFDQPTQAPRCAILSAYMSAHQKP